IYSSLILSWESLPPGILLSNVPSIDGSCSAPICFEGTGGASQGAAGKKRRTRPRCSHCMWIPNPTALCKSVPCSLQDESHAVPSSETRLILHRQREGELGAAELAEGDAFLLDAEQMNIH